jgi:transposase-like protein
MCNKYTTIDYGKEGITDKEILIRYLEGTPTRKIATQIVKDQSTVIRIIHKAMRRVPNTNDVTKLYCNKFSRILIVDAKYVKIKGYPKKIAFIWAIDYGTHDIVYQRITSTENSYAYYTMFEFLRKCNYQLKYLVCDELECIRETVKLVFPKCHVQICIKHYKANIFKALNRFDESDMHFFKKTGELFKSHNMKEFGYIGRSLFNEFGLIKKYRTILLGINLKASILTTYLEYYDCPSTSNLIELYNSHLEARLKSIKGFSSFEYAEIWLNAYVMNRRLRKFTDCSKKFKRLNGRYSLQETLKEDAPTIYFLRSVR